VIAQRLKQLERFDITDQLWRVDTPTLIVAGSKDAIVPASRQLRLARCIPGAQLETIEGAGHIGFLTHRQEFARRVVQYLRNVKTPA
jgi:pimeloyl-ACP methyl ester carboxylesterase